MAEAEKEAQEAAARRLADAEKDAQRRIEEARAEADEVSAQGQGRS